MKTLDRAFLFAGLISLSFLIGVSSCGGDGKSEGDRKPTKQVIRTTLKKNVWKMSMEKMEAHPLDDYSFEFNNDGSVLALADNTVVNGRWSAFGREHGQLKLNIEFSPSELFNVLNDDWVVLETSDSRIVLAKVCSHSGKLDKLTLEKV